MSICKSSLEKIGKAAFNSLSTSDQEKYKAASNVVATLSMAIKNGQKASPDLISEFIIDAGVEIGTRAIIFLANSLCKTQVTTLDGAISCLLDYIKNAIVDLIDQIKHDIANKLAVLMGINENPGIIGAIMEYIYRIFVKPVFS